MPKNILSWPLQSVRLTAKRKCQGDTLCLLPLPKKPRRLNRGNGLQPRMVAPQVRLVAGPGTGKSHTIEKAGSTFVVEWVDPKQRVCDFFHAGYMHRVAHSRPNVLFHTSLCRSGRGSSGFNDARARAADSTSRKLAHFVTEYADYPK